MKTTLCIEGNYGEKNFSTYMPDYTIPKYGIHGYGNNAREAIADTYVSLDEMRALAAERGDFFPAENPEFELVFDIGAFFSYHDYLNISAVARRIGINASLMRRYATGKTQPSPARYAEIIKGLHAIAEEIQTANLGTTRVAS